MAGETAITVVGNLTADPELRFTPNGAAVANFTIASTPRHFDRQANDFKDGETLFLRCSAWREQGENIAETLQRGTRVIAQGKLKSRSFETREGEKRTVVELDVDEVGPSLRRATAQITKTNQSGSGYQQPAYSQQVAPSNGQQAGRPAWGHQPPTQDPWQAAAPQQGQQSSGAAWPAVPDGLQDEPPF